LMQVMPTPLSSCGIRVETSGRENPMPGPFASSLRILQSEGARKLDPSGAPLEVASMLVQYPLQVPGNRGLQGGRKHGDAILVTLAAPNHDLIRSEVHVFHAQSTAFEQAQSCAIHERGHDPRDAIQPIQEDLYLFHC